MSAARYPEHVALPFHLHPSNIIERPRIQLPPPPKLQDEEAKPVTEPFQEVVGGTSSTHSTQPEKSLPAKKKRPSANEEHRKRLNTYFQSFDKTKTILLALNDISEPAKLNEVASAVLKLRPVRGKVSTSIYNRRISGLLYRLNEQNLVSKTTDKIANNKVVSWQITPDGKSKLD